MRRVARIVLLAYLGVVALGVFGAEPGAELDAAADRLRDLEQEVRDDAGDAEPWFDDLRAEPFFNVVVFVPLGALFPLAVPQLRWLTPLLGAQLSGAIEGVQDLLLDHRSPRVDDIRWNALGTAIGFALWLASRGVSRICRARFVP